MACFFVLGGLNLFGKDVQGTGKCSGQIAVSLGIESGLPFSKIKCANRGSVYDQWQNEFRMHLVKTGRSVVVEILSRLKFLTNTGRLVMKNPGIRIDVFVLRCDITLQGHFTILQKKPDSQLRQAHAEPIKWDHFAQAESGSFHPFSRR